MKTPPPYITLIFPAYNEAGRIAGAIAEAKAYFTTRRLTYEIIVAADGDDGTREIVREMAQTDPTLRVIGSVERQGKGHAVQEAVALAAGDVIGYSDADNKTPIDEFDKLMPFLTDHDLVIGSRGLRESVIERRQPFYRQIGSKGFAIFMHLVTGLHDMVDTQCGFKFFNRPVALDLFSRQQIDGYMFDVELLYHARKCGYRIAQVPIRWRDDGDSRLDLFSGNVRNVIDIFRIRLASSPRRVGTTALAGACPDRVVSGNRNGL